MTPNLPPVPSAAATSTGESVPFPLPFFPAGGGGGWRTGVWSIPNHPHLGRASRAMRVTVAQGRSHRESLLHLAS